MMRGLLLILWGWVVLWSVISGRVDLLMRSVFHSLVATSGVALIVAGLWIALRAWIRPERGRRERLSRSWMVSALIALIVLLIPPNPSFSDLAATRPQGLPEPPDLAFVLPPEQRTLTEWVRLLRSQGDPDLAAGNPVNITGFVWDQPDGPALIARLTVRCCLADATPAGLAVAWPDGMTPQTNQWLAITGTMAVEQREGQPVAVVVPDQIRPVDRPDRPFEP